MGRDRRSDSSAAGAVIAVLVVLILSMVGGGVAGAGVWFLRSSQVRQEALVQRERAMLQEVRAREAVVRAQAAETGAAIELKAVEEGITRLLTLKVDHAGALRLDDESLTLADLKIQSDEREPVELELQVDDRCLAKHVLAVVKTCDETGLANVQIASLTEHSATHTAR